MHWIIWIYFEYEFIFEGTNLPGPDSPGPIRHSTKKLGAKFAAKSAWGLIYRGPTCLEPWFLVLSPVGPKVLNPMIQSFSSCNCQLRWPRMVTLRSAIWRPPCHLCGPSNRSCCGQSLRPVGAKSVLLGAYFHHFHISLFFAVNCCNIYKFGQIIWFLLDPGLIIVYPCHSLTDTRPCWRLNELT